MRNGQGGHGRGSSGGATMAWAKKAIAGPSDKNEGDATTSQPRDAASVGIACIKTGQ